MSMADESVRDVVRRVRATLQEKGPVGTFLLAELDAAISRGVEDLSMGSGKGRTASETPGRRSPNEAELLGLLYGVFDTYLITLPSVAASLTTHLREHFGVDHCEVTLDSSLLGDELQLAGRARIDSIVPEAPKEQVIEAIGVIGRLAKRENE
jgi:hypothetical protein